MTTATELKVRRRTEWLEQAGILTEALPNMRRYAGKTVVIKYGGHAMGDATLAQKFARDVVLLKQVGINPIVVHGGGPQIGRMLDRLGIKSEFINGLRRTDAATMEIVEMVLAGKINKEIVSAITDAGGRAVGLSGKDAGLIRARKVADEDGVDMGFVGEPAQVDPTILEVLRSSDIIPVIAPIGMGPDGQTYNINADTSAGGIAAAMKAKRFLLLTDVPGVLDKEGQLIQELTVEQASKLEADGVISGGMIPKVETCVNAVQQGVDAAVIVDGRAAHAVLLEIFTEHGSGTLIRR